MAIRWRNASSKPKELTGRTVLLCLVAFFAVVTGINAVMIRFAVSTFGGVETESAYQAGLAFARETREAAAQDALHWQVSATVSAAGGDRLVEVTARDAAGRPLAGLGAAARLAHPTDKRLDHVIELHERGAGRFEGRSDAPAGQWTLLIELDRDGARMFRSRNRVFLK
jgi:nitrogen fixation protein FixH